MNPRSLEHEYALDEMEQQYKWMTWLQFCSFFVVGFFGLGVIMYLAAKFHKMAFRRKVAEMGDDPEAWARPLREHAFRVLLFGLTLSLVLAGIGILLMRMKSFAPSPYMPDTTRS
jgi:ribose/xylose/arabinose/galactoside ABC-type transport system permease subunit